MWVERKVILVQVMVCVGVSAYLCVDQVRRSELSWGGQTC